MLTTKELIKITGKSQQRIQQLAKKMQELGIAEQNQWGYWLFKPEAINFVNNQPKPGPKTGSKNQKKTPESE